MFMEQVIIIIHLIISNLVWNGCGIVMEWLFINITLVLYGLGDYGPWRDGLMGCGHVKCMFLFLQIYIIYW